MRRRNTSPDALVVRVQPRSTPAGLAAHLGLLALGFGFLAAPAVVATATAVAGLVAALAHQAARRSSLSVAGSRSEGGTPDGNGASGAEARPAD